MEKLLSEIRACTLCEAHLPNAPRPVIAAHLKSKIMIIGQAPGQKVQNSGIPWDDQSGAELRRWLGVSPADFYDVRKFAIVPMGFCYPGKGKSGDLPPRPECAAHWHERVLQKLKGIKLILLIGTYAQTYYLGEAGAATVTENVRNFKRHLPKYLSLVHPSPRNKIWRKRNPWFETEVVPELRRRVAEILAE